MDGKESLFLKIIKSEFMHNYKRSFSAISGSIIIFLVISIALFGPLFTKQNPYDLTDIDLSDAYKPPVWMSGGDTKFLLGTDGQGRDMVSAIIYGSRTSIFIGIAVVGITCFIGTILGIVSGYYGGIIDSFIMRIADVQLSFPSMLIALFIIAIFGRGMFKLIITLSIVGWVIFARTVRGETLSIKKKEYIDATKALGFSDSRIIFRHILPNVITSIIVIFTIRIGNVILMEATLSFLGVGVPVTKPSLGLLVKNGFDVLFSGLWWVSVFPGLYIMIVVFGINLLGDFLKDELNPELK